MNPCITCNGNGSDTPCAYPGEGKPGCRLAKSDFYKTMRAGKDAGIEIFSEEMDMYMRENYWNGDDTEEHY